MKRSRGMYWPNFSIVFIIKGTEQTQHGSVLIFQSNVTKTQGQSCYSEFPLQS